MSEKISLDSSAFGGFISLIGILRVFFLRPERIQLILLYKKLTFFSVDQRAHSCNFLKCEIPSLLQYDQIVQ